MFDVPDSDYDVTGAGPALLLIHGLGSCMEDWKCQVPSFAGHYRVIRYVIRGHGRHRLISSRVTIATLADDAARLLTELEAGPTHVVGLSLGGAVALQLCLDYPQCVRSLTLINTMPSYKPGSWRERVRYVERLVMVGILGMRIAGIILARRLFPSPDQRDMRKRLAARYAANRRSTHLTLVKALAQWDVTNRLGEIHLPVLVLASEHDYTPVAAKRAYAAALPRARLEVIPGAHHAVPLEKPDEFNRLLQEFLNDMNQAGCRESEKRVS